MDADFDGGSDSLMQTVIDWRVKRSGVDFWPFFAYYLIRNIFWRILLSPFSRLLAYLFSVLGITISSKWLTILSSILIAYACRKLYLYPGIISRLISPVDVLALN